MTDDDSPPDPQLTPIQGGGVPIFGRRSAPLDERKYRQFGVEVETRDDRFDAIFEAYLDPDGGAVLNLMNARTELAQANATAVLLGSSLRDDDGCPSQWKVPVEPAYDDEGNVERTEPTDEHPDGEPLYEWWNGDLLTAVELRTAVADYDDLADGSSMRRFQFIMDSPHHRVKIEALTEIGEWLVGDLAKRPTRRPTPSQRGPQHTGRGRGGRSRG